MERWFLMVSKLGPHIIEPYRIKPYDSRIAQAKPRIIKVVGGTTELGIMSYFNTVLGSQNHLYIARVYPYEKAVTDAYNAGASPYEAADIMIAALGSFVHANGYGYAYFECGMNEPQDYTIPWLNQYYAYIVPRLKDLGIRTVSFNFSVCHPPLAAWSQLGNAINTIKQAGREWAIVGLHQYGLFGNMQDYAQAGDDSRVLRHREIKELEGVEKAITECGLDEPGWTQTGINSEDYFADWQWLDYELRKDDDVIGAVTYTMDSDPRWAPHRIIGSIADHLFDYWNVQNAETEPIFGDDPYPNPDPLPPPPAPGLGAYRVTAHALNVRSSPMVDGATNRITLPDVCPLPEGAEVEVLEFSGNWARIATPFETWVHSDYIEEI
jgi:hypothetical protein